ncbi:hypothetical protein [Saccharopolyspora taberi]|uniref:hypothetical protein n=1 Tax=Saccharopolyspora taberi TaxID=60895 RepID=UPI0031D1EA27
MLGDTGMVPVPYLYRASAAELRRQATRMWRRIEIERGFVEPTQADMSADELCGFAPRNMSHDEYYARMDDVHRLSSRADELCGIAEQTEMWETGHAPRTV